MGRTADDVFLLLKGDMEMLAWILTVGAVLCLAYFIMIVLYSGIGTSLAVIWLLFAGGLGAAAFSVRCCQRYPEKIDLRLPVALVTLCAAGLVILVLLQILIFGRIPVIADSGLDYLIVLGAQVRGEEPSKTLRLRLDKAAEYALQNPETTLILSGGQGENEAVSEAEAMKIYLLEQGVSEDRMVLEARSSSTVENIAYSRELVDKLWSRRLQKLQEARRSKRALGLAAIDREIERPMRIGILTSNFHLYRAKMIAKHQGLTEVSGIAAESDRILLIHFCFRDGLAILKDRIAGNL